MKLFSPKKMMINLKKNGAVRFFCLVYHNFFDLVILNLLFVLTAAPIVTIGASYKALVESCGRCVNYEGGSPIRTFFKAFRAQFLKSTLYGIFFLLLFSIIAFAAAFYYNLAKQNVIFYFVGAVCTACAVVLLLMVGSFFPLYTKIEQGFFALLVNSFVLAFSDIKSSLLYLLSALTTAFVSLMLFPHSLPITLSICFSFSAFVSSFCSNDKITKFFIENTQEGKQNDSGHISS